MMIDQLYMIRIYYIKWIMSTHSLLIVVLMLKQCTCSVNSLKLLIMVITPQGFYDFQKSCRFNVKINIKPPK